MTTEKVPNVPNVPELPVPAETPEVSEKKKFYRNPKVVAGAVAAAVAAGIALVIHGKKNDSEPETETDVTTGEDTEVVETFDEAETNTLD